MKHSLSKIFLLITLMLLSHNHLRGTSLSQLAELDRSDAGALFLLINPDATGFSLGESGVTYGSEAFAAYYNPGVLTLLENRLNFGYTCFDWLPEITDDIYVRSFFSNYNFGKNLDLGSVGLGYIYINEGKNVWINEAGELLGLFEKEEYMAMLSYAHSIFESSNHFLGLGINGKYIHSALVPPYVTVGAVRSSAIASAFAVDLGLAYSLKNKHRKYPWEFRGGISVLNIGTDINYTNYETSESLPRTLRFGCAGTFTLKYNDIPVFDVTPQWDIQMSLLSDEDESDENTWRESLKSLGMDVSFFETINLRAGYIVDYDYHYDSYAEEWRSTNYYTVGYGICLSETFLKLIGITENFPFSFKIDFGYIPEQFNQNDELLPLSDTRVISIDISITDFSFL